jgi:hypothetical protein
MVWKGVPPTISLLGTIAQSTAAAKQPFGGDEDIFGIVAAPNLGQGWPPKGSSGHFNSALFIVKSYVRTGLEWTVEREHLDVRTGKGPGWREVRHSCCVQKPSITQTLLLMVYALIAT